MARHITVESVAYCSEDENYDGCEPLPFERLAAFNAFAIVDRHCDESRNHQDPNNGNLVRGSHGARKEIVGRLIRSRQRTQPWAARVCRAAPAGSVLRTPKAVGADKDALQSAFLFLRGLMPVVTQQRRICAGLQRILRSFFG